MAILSWNIRGIGKLSKWQLLRDNIKQAKCKVICFQETKAQSLSHSIVASAYGNLIDSWLVVEAQGSSGGIFTGWNSNEIFGSLFHKGRFSINTLHSLPHQHDCKWLLSNVYGPVDSSLKSSFLVELSAVRAT